jgi:hypothetical protein
MASTLKFGNGNWATIEGSALAYNDENGNFKPLPFDYSRDGLATAKNKDGLIEFLNESQPKIDYTGNSKGALLLEPDSTNFASYSEDFTQSDWNKLRSSITSNSVISPDGTLNASSFTQSGGLGRHSISNSFTNITSGAGYTASIFLKYDDWQYFQVRFNSGGVGQETGVIYDAVNKTVTTTNGSLLNSTVEEYANDWVRISSTSMPTVVIPDVGLLVAYNGSGDFFNDTESVPNTEANVYVYGAQIEEKIYPSSYIKTEGGSVTRIADECNDAGNDQVFNPSEGVLYAEFSALSLDNSNRYIIISDGTTSNRVVIRLSPTDNEIRALVSSAGSDKFNKGYVVSDVTQTHKVAVKYSLNDFALWIDGSERATDTNGNPPININQLNLSRSQQQFEGRIKSILVFNEALTDAELAELTS